MNDKPTTHELLQTPELLELRMLELRFLELEQLVRSSHVEQNGFFPNQHEQMVFAHAPYLPEKTAIHAYHANIHEPAEVYPNISASMIHGQIHQIQANKQTDSSTIRGESPGCSTTPSRYATARRATLRDKKCM